MSVWAIVPVKPLNRAKSRLAGVLTQEERIQVSRDLLVQTLRVLGETPEVERTLVVSRDGHALAMARELGAQTVTERGGPQLNRALARATAMAKGYRVGGVLVLPADLPWVTREDLQRMLGLSQPPPVVVIAPDRHRSGTNALLCAPPGLIEYDFGPDSYSRHQTKARQAGARLELCELPGLALDLDLPEDLELMRAGPPMPRSSADSGKVER